MRNGFPSREEVANLRQQYPADTRVRLLFMDDSFAVPSGTEGTVQMVDCAGHIHVAWDNGRALSLIPGVDAFVRIVDVKAAKFGLNHNSGVHKVGKDGATND